MSSTWTYKIFPPIGIARIGNSTEYYVGPEIPGTVVVPPDGSYRELQTPALVRRQAARFHIFACDQNGTPTHEITPDAATIKWTVKLANTKAAFNQFQGIGHLTGPLRNASVSNRSLLMNTPLPCTLYSSDKGQASSIIGSCFDTTVQLGEIRIDDCGYLLVLGGFGLSGSPSNAPLLTYANNDGWYDDISDGSVTAKVTLNGTTTAVDAAPAWVICPPTRFAPGVPQMISLYDTLLQAAVDRLGYSIPGPPSFTNDVYPILRSQMMMQWVSSKVSSSYYSALTAAISPTATYSQRDAVFQQLRPPSTPPTKSTTKLWPAVWSDYYAEAGGGWVNQPLTVTQYNIMTAWRDGNGKVTNDWAGPPSPASTITANGLTRAALENCSGGPFAPGIETSFLTRDKYPYLEPFRLDASQLSPGDLTKQNAVPWQADFLDCEFEPPLSWWPAGRPDDVVTATSKGYLAWERGLKTHMDMVKYWNELGFVLQSGNSFFETQRILPG
jgi:hypothetical protein